MSWREATEPVRMQRVALVAPVTALRDLLVQVADAGVVELDVPGADPMAEPAHAGEASRMLQHHLIDPAVSPLLSAEPPDLAALDRDSRRDLLAGESELERHAAAAVTRGEACALAGWIPAAERDALAARLAPVGAALVVLPTPPATDPPTLLRDGSELRGAFSPLVQTYATVPYADIDPTVMAGLAYVFMFGMMFGDAGQGLLLVLIGLLLRAGKIKRLARWRGIWPFVIGAGAAAVFFGLLYGEFFGPTGVVPVLWINPLDDPVLLLGVALGVGAVLLACAYAVGTINRWREGGWTLALSSASGIAGASLFAGTGLIVLGAVTDLTWLLALGVVVAAGGMLCAFVGFLAATEGRAAGVAQAFVELFDAVLRLGTNLISFARLAAFGMTHAALGQVIWDGTTALWDQGGLGYVAAVAVFVVGNAITFALEALVAGIQALRLEYYELFSRVFSTEGRPFDPWHVPVERPEPAGQEIPAYAEGTREQPGLVTTPGRHS